MRIKLQRGRHLQRAAARVGIQIAYGTCVAKSCTTNQRHLRAPVFAARVAKSGYGASDLLLQRVLAGTDLMPGIRFAQRRQVAVFQCVGADIEICRQRARLIRRHHGCTFDIPDRQIKAGADTVPDQQISEAQIQRMTIIYRQTEHQILHEEIRAMPGDFSAKKHASTIPAAALSKW